LKFYLYVAKNDGIIHLAIRQNNDYHLICNTAVGINRHRVCEDAVGVYLIAPIPVRKHRCKNCERTGIKLFKNLKF